MKADNQLEKDLQQLGRLMKPDPHFATRVMEQIDAAETHRPTSRRWLLPIGVSLAASFLLAFGWIAWMHPASEQNPNDPPQLVRTSTEWQTVSERPVTLDGEVPAREVSRQKFERVKWEDPKRHATFERVVPREKVTFVTLERY